MRDKESVPVTRSVEPFALVVVAISIAHHTIAAWGMIYNGTFTEGDTRFDLDDVYSVVGSFIRNPQ